MSSKASIHPATTWGFDELVQALRSRVESKLVKEVVAPYDRDLSLYCYTQNAVVDRAWDPVVEMARGLVLDHRTKTIAAKPFPKFFNFGERSASVPDEPFEVTEKMDGSLGIAFFHERDKTWRMATKGSFTSPQAERGKSMLDSLNTRALVPGWTYLFEIIYPENRIVIRYPFEGLVMLAAYDDVGEVSRHQLEIDAREIGVSVVGSVTSYRSMQEMVDACATFASDTEGFVVRFASGLRLKIKGAEYLRVHRMVSNITPLSIWDGMRNRQDIDVVRREIPEEFWSDFDQIRSLLSGRFEAVVRSVNEVVPRFAAKTDKEIGLSLSSVPEDVRPYIFSARKKGERWHEDEKSWSNLWRSIRPTANVLAGYNPSLSLRAVQEEV